LNVTSDHLEVLETVLLYAMATVKRELSQKKKLKLITQDSFQRRSFDWLTNHSHLFENIFKLTWFQQQDAVAIWFAMALVAVDHVKSIVKNHVMALLMMEPLTVTLVSLVKWTQTVLNAVLMLLLMNQLASAIFNALDLAETASWFVPMVALTLPPPQLQPLPRKLPLQQLPQRLLRRRPLPQQQLQQRSVKDVGQLVTSIVDHQSVLMTQDGFGKIPMTTVVSLN